MRKKVSPDSQRVGQGGARGVDSEKSRWSDATLHLAAIEGRLVGLKNLIELNGEDDEMVNHKDENHKVSAYFPGLNVNAIANNGYTALDALKQSPRALRDLETKSILRDAGALSSNDLHVVAVEWIPSPPKIPRKPSALMVVSSLIATVAYQAAISPPGGILQAEETVNDEGNPLEHPRKAGTAIMAYNQGIEYGQVMIFNTLAFLASLRIILLLGYR
ncbi:hypothetical protein F3Y22_tig00110985pilonHSYRG00016 [Hibiscus syriacus]|uniref:PGG domain-containing protein n=1 Tax=Hibiscus syriacus TaxID=106335 RepID=A0A6A2Z9U2_HIBSY|nr:hypothetical protein F3Y22_tig00110985pilonHSYRG00016 [Hibiscus syriacus]